MSPIALLGARASIPSRGIAWRASRFRVVLTITPIAPITQARFAIKTNQCLPAPFRFVPTTFGEAVLPSLSRPLFLRFSVRRRGALVLIARKGSRCFFRKQSILSASSPAQSE